MEISATFVQLLEGGCVLSNHTVLVKLNAVTFPLVGRGHFSNKLLKQSIFTCLRPTKVNHLVIPDEIDIQIILHDLIQFTCNRILFAKESLINIPYLCSFFKTPKFERAKQNTGENETTILIYIRDQKSIYPILFCNLLDYNSNLIEDRAP